MLQIIDLATLSYQAAWDKQLDVHSQVSIGDAGPYPAGALILVEHPPVITIGRHPGSSKHLLASPALLQLRGVELTETDRGGDITFHGPGQLVAYPIIPLNTYNLNLHNYMRLLEDVVIDTLAAFGITGTRAPGATGVWIEPPIPQNSAPPPAQPPLCCIRPGAEKICAMGVKLRRWVTFHGLALNVTTDLSYFQLINPCGLSRPVTSMRNLLADKTPPMPLVKQTLTDAFQRRLAQIAAAKSHATP